MKRNKAIFYSCLLILPLAAWLSFMSIRRAPLEDVDLYFAMGGSAALRNTIELPLSELERLTIRYGSKNIKLFATDEEKVIIKEYLYSKSPDAIAKVTHPSEGETVVKGGTVRSLAFFGFGERIEVYVPREGLDSFYLETRSGNVTMEKLQGTIEVCTGSGNIKGEDIQGSLKATAGSGNITLEDFSGKGQVEAGSGNVKMEALAVTGDLSLTTGSGNIRLELPRESSFDFQAETGSGNIDTDFDKALSYNKKGNNAEGSVSGDNAASAFKVKMKAGSGNVRVAYR